MTKRSIHAAVLAALLLAGATGVPAQITPPDSSTAGLEIPQSDNEMREVTGSVLYESAEGDYSVTLPSGCAMYRERRTNPGSLDEDSDALVMTIFTYCDRKGYSNEGCSVAAYVDQDLDAGPPADPGFVLTRVQAILQEYGVEILQQKPYRRQVPDGPLMEGVDVLAADPDRTGQVWVRGLLVEGDVYLLVAWRAHGQLHVDPDYVNFFESFVAHM